MADIYTKAIILVVYVVGYLLGYSMSKIAHLSEGHTYTKLDRLMNLGMSCLSWLLVLFILVQAWFTVIAQTGYWKQPAKTPKTMAPLPKPVPSPKADEE